MIKIKKNTFVKDLIQENENWITDGFILFNKFSQDFFKLPEFKTKLRGDELDIKIEEIIKKQKQGKLINLNEKLKQNEFIYLTGIAKKIKLDENFFLDIEYFNILKQFADINYNLNFFCNNDVIFIEYNGEVIAMVSGIEK